MSNNSWAVSQNYGPTNPYGGYPGTGRIIVPKSKLKVALPRSLTKTRTKTKNKEKWSTDFQSGIKYKTVNISYKATKIAKLTKALSQPGTTYFLSTNGALSGVGRQEASVTTQVLGADVINLHKAINDATATTTERLAEKMLWSGSKDDVEFMNCSPTPIELDIYVLIDKTTQIVNTDPKTLWDAGIVAEQNAPGDAPTESRVTPWLKPTEHKLFNINYWTKRYPVHLTPGERCKFTLNFRRNRVLDISYAHQFQTIRGLTHKIMVVQRGSLIDGTNLKTFTAGLQSLSETKLVWLWKNTLYGRLLSTLPKVHKQLGTNIPITALAQWHIDEDTGEPEDANVTTEFA